jgi:AhpD family alkylhydroperoxidase
MTEPQRMNLAKLIPEAYRHILELERTVTGHVEPKLYRLIKLRASQVNGCAFCIAMHTDEALRAGEATERLTLLDAWEESSLYSDKERSALAWVEDITLIAEHRAPGHTFENLRAHFSDEEVGWLTMAAVQINCWNRLQIASRSQYTKPSGPLRDSHKQHAEETV